MYCDIVPCESSTASIHISENGKRLTRQPCVSPVGLTPAADRSKLAPAVRLCRAEEDGNYHNCLPRGRWTEVSLELSNYPHGWAGAVCWKSFCALAWTVLWVQWRTCFSKLKALGFWSWCSMCSCVSCVAIIDYGHWDYSTCDHRGNNPWSNGVLPFLDLFKFLLIYSMCLWLYRLVF